MKLFLTSTLGGSIKENGLRIPCELSNMNHFVELLSELLPKEAKCLIISSDPDNELVNDSIKCIYEEAFILTNIPLSRIEIIDRRNEHNLQNKIYDSDLIILAGGHVPTQNRFFNRIGMRDLLKNYDGIIIGSSAGTMNCADVVYAQPELDGEAIDVNYERYLEGLSLTTINVLPHFQDINNYSVDGLRALEDISFPDSIVRPFYGLIDGSFILIDDEKSILYGEAYYLENGNCIKLCDINQSIKLDII